MSPPATRTLLANEGRCHGGSGDLTACVMRAVVALALLAVGAAFAGAAPGVAAASNRGLHLVDVGEVGYIALGADGTPWFSGSSHISHVTSDGQVTRYAVPGSYLVGLVWGPDRAVWAIDQITGGVIRLSGDGRLSRYPNVWATEKELRDDDTLPAVSLVPDVDGTVWLGD